MSDLLLVKLDQARVLLAEATTIQAAKQIVSMAAAAEEYAREANLSVETYNYAAEIRLRAERRLGEILRETPKNEGRAGMGRPSLGTTKTEAPKPAPIVPRLADVGITYKQSSRAQKLAKIPEEQFEEHIVTKKSKGDEITATDLLREVTAGEREERRDERVADLAARARPINNMPATYPILYADPPWQYDDNTTDPTRVIENQYPTMTLEELCALPVSTITTGDAILFMWATNPLLRKAMLVLDAWGFAYQTNLVWVKDKIGMGYWFRQQHELLLVATRGTPPKPRASDRAPSVFTAPRREHSSKPDGIAEVIERYYPELPKVELFARRVRPGWAVWGNEV